MLDYILSHSSSDPFLSLFHDLLQRIFQGKNTISIDDLQSEDTEDTGNTDNLKSNMADKNFPEILGITHNKLSSTTTVSSYMLDTIRRYLEANLNLTGGNSQSGYIYRTKHKPSKSVTLHVTTNKMHVQGPGYTPWVNSFIDTCNSKEFSDTSREEINDTNQDDFQHQCL